MEKGAKKSKSVRPVPEGFHTVTPYLIVDGAAELLEFIKNAFGGTQTYITKGENDSIMHATIRIGDSLVMVSDTMDDTPPQTAMLYLYVESTDDMYKKAINAKATSVHEPTSEFYGDRAAAVKDKWGNVWWMATHEEDVDAAEIEKRKAQHFKDYKRKKEEAHA
jgi:PhnB protein